MDTPRSTFEPQRFDDAPGAWSASADGVTVTLDDGEELRPRHPAHPLRTGYTQGSLHVLFTDATSGVTTYPANRSLAVAAPDPDGTVTLDFNRAVNLPCAYTEFATCPLPPAGNRLPVAVEAGEKMPR